MKKIYISGPYYDPDICGIHQNIQLARVEAEKWWAREAAVFCPHLNSAFMDGLTQRENFLAADLLFLECCDLMIVCRYHGDSAGVAQEIQHAREKNIPIWYALPSGRPDRVYETSSKESKSVEAAWSFCHE